MIGKILKVLFGGGRNVASEVIETFRPNAEASAQRAADAKTAALAQFAAEFAQPSAGLFDRFINGLNRLPRPIMALGTIGFFAGLFYDPVAFAARMAPLELVPAELWWLLGAVVTFYFGAREMQKSRQRRGAPDVAAVLKSMQAIEATRPAPQDDDPVPPTRPTPRDDDPAITENAAIAAWKKGN